MLLFLIALFSVIEFGWFFLHQNTLTAAVRDGIRLGAIGSSLDDGQGGQMSREASIKEAIKNRAEGVMDIDTAKILVFPVKADFTDDDDPTPVSEYWQFAGICQPVLPGLSYSKRTRFR